MIANFFGKLLNELKYFFNAVSQSDVLFFWILVLLVVLVIVLETFSKILQIRQKASGVNPEVKSIFFTDKIFKETKEYVSETQLLSAKPDALLVEGGYVIPVERKINTNKIRDRFVIELLISMRLIAEFEGKNPPYGYLILGANARQVKILNTKSRQDWLDQYLNQMRKIVNKEEKAKAFPELKKCSNCLGKDLCEAKIVSKIR